MTQKLIKKRLFKFQNVIPNTHLVVELLDLVRNKILTQFNREYFQQFFGIIMGTNVAPILANLYLAILEQDLEIICSAINIQCASFYKRFIADGFGIFIGTKKHLLHG